MEERATPPPKFPDIYDTFDNFISQYLSASQAELKNKFTSMEGDVLHSYVSCGVSLLAGLQGVLPQKIVNKVLKERAKTDVKKIREAFVVFSDVENSYGNTLYKYIRDNNLGEITEFGPRTNPNTGNRIVLYVWLPPHESLAPVDRTMPVRGTTLISTPTGPRYVDDTRFQGNLNTREA